MARPADLVHRLTGARLTELDQDARFRFTVNGTDSGTAGRVGDLTEDDWDWGQTTVRRITDMAVEVLERAVRPAGLGSPERVGIVQARERLKPVLGTVRADRHCLDFGPLMPDREVDEPGRVTGTAALIA